MSEEFELSQHCAACRADVDAICSAGRRIRAFRRAWRDGPFVPSGHYRLRCDHSRHRHCFRRPEVLHPDCSYSRSLLGGLADPNCPSKSAAIMLLNCSSELSCLKEHE